MTRTAVIVPRLKGGGDARRNASPKRRSSEARLAESVGLARAIDLDVAMAVIVPLTSHSPRALFGTGKVSELADAIAAESISLVVVDHALTPVQQRNLEKAWNTKVIDRTGLILEIFGERARTREGRLQVELAHLNYQKGRLVRSWTHLERQRGGYGFLGGPGETQIEADRRQIQERIGRIERELVDVVKSRRIQRTNRRRAARLVVALVGYTNAGKTTLFNALTQSTALAEDLLFATLDPTLRRTKLPHGTEIIISDTVGFISDLPTHLIAAFRATLEEVIEADLILHVRDIAHPDSAVQASDVLSVLEQLGIGDHSDARILEVSNKIDLLEGTRPPGEPNVLGAAAAIPVSAITGAGIVDLLTAIEDRLHAKRSVYSVHLAGNRLAVLHRAYDLAEILERSASPDGATDLLVRVSDKSRDRFLEAFPEAVPSPPVWTPARAASL